MSSAQQRFWRWFADYQEEIFDFESDRERVFHEVGTQLSRVHRDLCFEFGPKNTQREFVISAGGLRNAFPAVTSLVAAAPVLERWRIVAFRPRRDTICSVQIGDTSIEPSEVEFSLLTKGEAIGIRLFIRGASETNSTVQQIGYLMLDEALGEYDVETRVGLIQMVPPDTPRTGPRHPLTELPLLFDQLVSQLSPRPLIH